MNFRNKPLGVIPSKPDFRDYRLQEFVNIEEQFPENYIAPPYTKEEDIPIYDQNGYGMCVAFSGALIKEQQEYRETGKAIRMAPGWIYGNRDDGMYMGEGMEPRDAWKMLCKDGVPSFSDFPILGDFSTCYGEVQTKKKNLEPEAQNNKTLSFVNVNFRNEAEIKTALMKCGFLNVDIAVYDSFYDCDSTGILKSVSGPIYGYHALTIAGWKTINGRTYWIIVNSWGREWGKNGICYMPSNYAAIQEMWAITDLERKTFHGDIGGIIVNPGYFMLPFRTVLEAIGAQISWRRDTDKKIVVEAIIPPCDETRKLTAKQDSKDVTIETVEG